MTHTRRIERIIVLRKGEGNSEGIVPWSFAYFTMPRTSICRKFRWPFQKLNSRERRLEGVEICQLFDAKFTRSYVFISVSPPPRRSILNFSLFHRMKIWLERKKYVYSSDLFLVNVSISFPFFFFFFSLVRITRFGYLIEPINRTNIILAITNR